VKTAFDGSIFCSGLSFFVPGNMFKIILLIVAIIIVAAIVVTYLMRRKATIEHAGAKITFEHIIPDWNFDFDIHIYMPKNYTGLSGLFEKIRALSMYAPKFILGLWIRTLLLHLFSIVDDSDMEVSGSHRESFAKMDGMLTKLSKSIDKLELPSSDKIRYYIDIIKMERSRQEAIKDTSSIDMSDYPRADNLEEIHYFLQSFGLPSEYHNITQARGYLESMQEHYDTYSDAKAIVESDVSDEERSRASLVMNTSASAFTRFANMLMNIGRSSYTAEDNVKYDVIGKNFMMNGGKQVSTFDLYDSKAPEYDFLDVTGHGINDKMAKHYGKSTNDDLYMPRYNSVNSGRNYTHATN